MRNNNRQIERQDTKVWEKKLFDGLYNKGAFRYVVGALKSFR